MKLPDYPKYKESGVEWLGKVPEHWDVKAIKWATSVQRGASPRPIDDPKYFEDEGEYAWVRISDVTASDVYLKETTQRLSDLGASLSVKMEPGSLFLSIAGSVGKACITKIKCCIHDGFVYFPTLEDDPKFLFYIFAAGEAYKGLGKLGTQLNLNTDTIGSIRIGFPSVPEQRAIVNFLDRETARLDTLIAKQERLIGLSLEKRRALISHTVTRGLDENVALKDSGVEWLGQVPDHWEITRLGFVATVKARLGWKGLKADEYVDSGYMFLSTPNIKDSEIDYKNVNFITTERYLESPEIMLKVGDVLIAKDGSTLGTLNVVRTLPAPATVNSSIAVLRPRLIIDSEYLGYFLRSDFTQNIIQRMKGGMGVPHLFQDDLKRFVVLLPSLSEQRVIVTYLESETAKIDTLIEKARRAIELMKEHRSALITAVVTGQIDVCTG